MPSVDIGFLEDCEPWQVESRLFPSKFGGKPAWLNLHDLPTSEELECIICKKPLIFLCQIYAPFEEDPNNFHRTIFVFICRNPQCCQRNSTCNLKVLRSVLKRDNKFYSYDPPSEEQDKSFSLSKWVKLCELCGCIATKYCSKCKAVTYCCRDHQVLDWKDRHRSICGSESSCRKPSKYLFPEKEIDLETEEWEEETVDEKLELERYKKLEAEGKTGTLIDVPEKEIESHAKIDDDDTFSKFRERIAKSKYADQVIRYELGGQPLWIAKQPVPSVIPDCEYCGSPRQFEFQIMPQTLSIIEENDIDWGVIIVYTCKSSCTDGKDYKKEYVFKQDVTLNDMN